jgi:hypothetical protein
VQKNAHVEEIVSQPLTQPKKRGRKPKGNFEIYYCFHYSFFYYIYSPGSSSQVASESTATGDTPKPHSYNLRNRKL